jgi:hypothetical protein
MMHGFMRTLLVVGFTSLASHMAAAQPSTTPAHTTPQTAPAAVATTPAQADPCATLTQDTSIVRSINKYGNVDEEPTVSTTSRRAMNAALDAMLKNRFKVDGQNLTIIQVSLPETMTMTADPRGQDFILNPAERSEAGPNKEITVYYPLTGFTLPVKVRRVEKSADGTVDYLADTNVVREDIELNPSTTPQKGLQLGIHMKSVSRADLSNNQKLNKFFDCDDNSRVCGFSAVDTVPVQQCSHPRGSGVLGTNSHMVQDMADTANYVQTSMPKHLDMERSRVTVDLDHAIWGSAAKAIAVETLRQQNKDLSAAEAKKMVDERFVGYVLSNSIPINSLSTQGIDVDSKQLMFDGISTYKITSSPTSSVFWGQKMQRMYIVIR